MIWWGARPHKASPGNYSTILITAKRQKRMVLAEHIHSLQGPHLPCIGPAGKYKIRLEIRISFEIMSAKWYVGTSIPLLSKKWESTIATGFWGQRFISHPLAVALISAEEVLQFAHAWQHQEMAQLLLMAPSLHKSHGQSPFAPIEE
jgi:hypothetical protein